jgi:hypothetical protein
MQFNRDAEGVLAETAMLEDVEALA